MEYNPGILRASRQYNEFESDADDLWRWKWEFQEFLITNLQLIFCDILVARNNAYFILVGLTIGTAGGFMLGVYLGRESIPHPIMKAVACLAFRGKEVNDLY